MTREEFIKMRHKLQSQDQVKQWRKIVRSQKEQKAQQMEKEEQKEKKKQLNQHTRRVRQDLQRQSEIHKMRKLLK